MLACSGMFGCVSGPVTTARCRAGRAEHRCRKRASNLHRSCVFVQDRMVGVGDRQALGGVDTPDDSGAGLGSLSSCVGKRVASRGLEAAVDAFGGGEWELFEGFDLFRDVFPCDEAALVFAFRAAV